MVLPAHRSTARRVRGVIAALCDLRESQAEAKKCASRADRSLDLATACKRRRHLERRCEVLRRKLQALEAPCAVPHTRKETERRFDEGKLAVAADSPECKGVATLGFRWRTAASRIVDLATVLRVLHYLERQPGWRRKQLACSVYPAVPRFVSTCSSHATLQNLPAWQSARITLLACAMSNRAAADRSVSAHELRRWVRAAGIHEAYHAGLEALRLRLQRS